MDNLPEPPDWPLLRIIGDGDVVHCPLCDSGYPRRWLIFGKRYCRQPKCVNSREHNLYNPDDMVKPNFHDWGKYSNRR